METCKECIHQDLCDVYSQYGITDVPANDISICELFKNKANVVEVRRGEWVKRFLYSRGYDDYYECTCSVCKKKYREDFAYEAIGNFCPNCGADMRGEKNG